MKTLFITDLDGTLLRTDMTLSPFTCETVGRLIGEGQCISVATARSRTTALRVMQGLEVSLPMVVYNGAFIVDSADGSILHKNTFSPRQAEEIYGAFLSNGLSPVVYRLLDGEERFSYCTERITPQTREHIESRRGDPRDDPLTGDEGILRGEVFYFTCIGREEALRPVFMQLSGRFEVLFYDDIYSGERWLEVMPREATKAASALRLKELLGCGRMVSFGDSVNDISLFGVSDESFAVANADPKAKSAAAHVILSNNEDAVARELLRLTSKG